MMPNGCFGSKVSDRPEVPSPSSFRITLKVSREFVESRIGFERIWKFLLGTRQTLEGPWLDRFPKEQPFTSFNTESYRSSASRPKPKSSDTESPQYRRQPNKRQFLAR